MTIYLSISLIISKITEIPLDRLGLHVKKNEKMDLSPT